MGTSRVLAPGIALLLLAATPAPLFAGTLIVKPDPGNIATGYYLIPRDPSIDRLLAHPPELTAKILNLRRLRWHAVPEQLFLPPGITFYLFEECSDQLRLQPRHPVTETIPPVTLTCRP